MTAADARPSTPAGRLATIDLEQELAVAVATADAAGSLVLAAFRQPSVVCRKGRHDVVTSMDLTSERLIMDRLGTAFPADRRLGEETGRARSPRGAAADRTWIVDPLDGTVNYAAGLPICAVALPSPFGRARSSGGSPAPSPAPR